MEAKQYATQQTMGEEIKQEILTNMETNENTMIHGI